MSVNFNAGLVVPERAEWDKDIEAALAAVELDNTSAHSRLRQRPLTQYMGVHGL